MAKLIDSMRKWFAGSKNPESSSGDSADSQPPSGAHEHYQSLRIQPTPNPHACQFIADKVIIASGSIGFASAEEAKGDVFAEALFNIYGVENVFIKENFLTITKSPVVGWNALVEEVEKAIETHLAFYESPPAKEREPASPPAGKELNLNEFLEFPDEQKLKIVNAVFDQAIRPVLANDGGDLVLLGIQGNTIQIHYQGACGTCPSATMGTLKYIEALLKENLHPDLMVEAQ
ncbi:MAG: NifU family protein [Nitrospinales bacterium]